MAVDIVPRKATGDALGVLGMASYVASGIQDVVSDWLIDGNSTVIETLDETTGQMVQATQYDFTPVAIFWVVASVISFILPILNWKYRK
jgi:OPA family sugar phosphate sensor protein UhpC-like MFS transporter